MRFLVDRCAGRRLAAWLRSLGHDVADAADFADDPGDAELLRIAAAQGRVVVTIDNDFGKLVFAQGIGQAGMVRLESVRVHQRIFLMGIVLDQYAAELEAGAIVTAKAGHIRVRSGPSSPPGSQD